MIMHWFFSLGLFLLLGEKNLPNSRYDQTNGEWTVCIRNRGKFCIANPVDKEGSWKSHHFPTTVQCAIYGRYWTLGSTWIWHLVFLMVWRQFPFRTAPSITLLQGAVISAPPNTLCLQDHFCTLAGIPAPSCWQVIQCLLQVYLALNLVWFL